MSYKDKKLKKSKINQLKYKLGLAFNKFFYKKLTSTRKEDKMRQVDNVMGELRKKAKLLRPNNMKINEWVDQYLRECMLEGKPVNILTQWCVSNMLKKRIMEQGGRFIPTKKEARVLQEEIPAICELFVRNGLRVNWWVTFNPTFIDPEDIPKQAYKEMILRCAKDLPGQEGMAFVDWEDDVLGKRAEPDASVVKDFFQYVSQKYFDLRVEQLKIWAQNERADWKRTEEQLKDDVKYATACEIAEAKLLTFENPVFGKECWILIPLDDAEAYDSFTIPVPDFKQRIVPVLPLCPWRMNS